MDNQKLIEKVKADEVKFISLQFTDLHGRVKALEYPVHRLEESLTKGTWFDGSSIEGFTRIAESDMFLRPDPDTYALLPWENGSKVARLIGDVYTPDGKPFDGDPRFILKSALRRAEDLGFIFNVGPELEFFLLNKEGKPSAHDVAGYFDHAPLDLAGTVRHEIVNGLEAMGMEVEMHHHEVAPGQHEIDFKYADALTTADNAITFKQVVKSIAHKHDLIASFMPKPFYGENGSGMHTHQSLFKEGKNVFFDPEDKDYRLSRTARAFIAGELNHIDAICAIASPTVNSYKRLVPGFEAPVYPSWGQKNRSALIRIPRYSEGREDSTRAELRCPDPSSNPYLAFAVMLHAGLDGIEKSMTPPEPIEESLYEMGEEARKERGIVSLPGNLGDAIIALEKNPIIMGALGPHAGPAYIHTKKAEWDAYRQQVSKWELDNYLETV